MSVATLLARFRPVAEEEGFLLCRPAAALVWCKTRQCKTTARRALYVRQELRSCVI